MQGCSITRGANVGAWTKQRQQSSAHPESPGTGERAARGPGMAVIGSSSKRSLVSKFEAVTATSNDKNLQFWQTLKDACSNQVINNPALSTNNTKFLSARADLIVDKMVEKLKDSIYDINRLFSALEPQLILPDNGILQLVKTQDRMPEGSAAGRCFNLYFNPIRTLKAEILVRLYDAKTDPAKQSSPSFDLGNYVVDDDKAGADKIGWTDLFLAASCIKKDFKTDHFEFKFSEESHTYSFQNKIQPDWLSSLYQKARANHTSLGDKESDDDLLGWYAGKAFNKRQAVSTPGLPVGLASGPAGSEVEEFSPLKLADSPAGSLLEAPPNLPKSAGVTDKWRYTNKIVYHLLCCVLEGFWLLIAGGILGELQDK